MEGWVDVEQFLIEAAEDDLRATGEVTPCLIACAGEEPLFAAFMRPFAPGAYADPMIELLALAMPLGADRLALSMAGRAWSLDDPVVPAVAGVGDLRQRVVCVHLADGSGDAPVADTRLRPFSVVDGAVVWDEELRPGPAEGWISQALLVSVSSPQQLRASPEELAAQAGRCVALGHQLYLAPAGDARMPAA